MCSMGRQDPRFPRADSEDPDQTGFVAGRTGHFVGCVTLVVLQLNYHYMI